MTKAQNIADRYIATWNATDADRRAKLLADHWAKDAHYVDPMQAASNAAGLNDLIAGAHAQFPGHSFELRTEADGYGDHVRLFWALTPKSGKPLAYGSDVLTLDEQGRITHVIGFLDGAAS